MTENEKLRALLAEARKIVQGVLRAANSTPYAQWSRDQHQAEIVRDAIDAALAEPVGEPSPDYRQGWGAGYVEGAAEYKRERDEARAEVERLQAELTRVGRVEFDRGAKQGIDQALWASQTARETAYKRGAEAMREAAMGAAWHSAAMGLHKRIKEMPVPEDKP